MLSGLSAKLIHRRRAQLDVLVYIGRFFATIPFFFRQVRECTRRSDQELLAVKIMERRSRETGHWSNENMFRREVQLLGTLGRIRRLKRKLLNTSLLSSVSKKSLTVVFFYDLTGTSRYAAVFPDNSCSSHHIL